VSSAGFEQVLEDLATLRCPHSCPPTGKRDERTSCHVRRCRVRVPRANASPRRATRRDSVLALYGWQAPPWPPYSTQEHETRAPCPRPATWNAGHPSCWTSFSSAESTLPADRSTGTRPCSTRRRCCGGQSGSTRGCIASGSPAPPACHLRDIAKKRRAVGCPAVKRDGVHPTNVPNLSGANGCSIVDTD